MPYIGTHDGTEYKSLYPRLYRVSYRQYIAGRTYDVDRVVSAIDASHARARQTGDIRGGIDVEHVADLTQA